MKKYNIIYSIKGCYIALNNNRVIELSQKDFELLSKKLLAISEIVSVDALSVVCAIETPDTVHLTSTEDLIQYLQNL